MEQEAEKKPAWSREEAESRYVGSEITLKQLSQESGCALSTVTRWCKAGGWVKKREKVRKRALRKAAGKAVDKKAKELAKLLEASDEIEAALLTAARAFRKNMEADADGMLTTDGKLRAGNLSQIVAALGRQTETRMLQSGLIKKPEEDENGKVLRVIFEGGAEEMAE